MESAEISLRGKDLARFKASEVLPEAVGPASTKSGRSAPFKTLFKLHLADAHKRRPAMGAGPGRFAAGKLGHDMADGFEGQGVPCFYRGAAGHGGCDFLAESAEGILVHFLTQFIQK